VSDASVNADGPTPGEWITGYGLIAGYEDECFGVGVRGDPWTPICFVSKSAKVNARDKANATLIASAKHLLAALHLLTAETWPEWPATAQVASLHIARAAIARAEAK